MPRFKNLFSRTATDESKQSRAEGSTPASGADERASIFVACSEQVENVRHWNAKRAWGFTQTDLAQVADASTWPGWPVDPLTAVVLVPYLEDMGSVLGIHRTFDELWSVAVDRQPAALGPGMGLRSDPAHLRLVSGAEHSPGLWWEIIDLGANRGEDPAAVRDAETSPHAGVLAAAGHFPAWVQAMNPAWQQPTPGAALPVFLPGYEATMEIPEGFVRAESGEPARERPWEAVPGLFWDVADREMRLFCYGLADAAHPHWAVPTFR